MIFRYVDYTEIQFVLIMKDCRIYTLNQYSVIFCYLNLKIFSPTILKTSVYVGLSRILQKSKKHFFPMFKKQATKCYRAVQGDAYIGYIRYLFLRLVSVIDTCVYFCSIFAGRTISYSRSQCPLVGQGPTGTRSQQS